MKATETTAAAVSLKEFENRAALAVALAEHVAANLAAAIQARGSASIALSGGSTPKEFLRALSRERIDWSKVMVTLVDERDVPADHERSNQRLIAENLLRNAAAQAQFVPLRYDPVPGADIAETACKAIDAIPRPFDVVVLGMGMDGHTASFFPAGSALAAALSVDCPHSVILMEAPDAGEPRLTITLPRLTEAGFLALHIEGADKRRVLDEALALGAQEDMPIRAIFRHAPKPVCVYWAP